MLTYLKVIWHHEFPDEPVVMLSEIRDGREVRKVEKFRDGRAQYAGPSGESGDTVLSETPLPPAGEIARDPQFTVEPTDAHEFEAEWDAALRS